jgi:hypothetical protein
VLMIKCGAERRKRQKQLEGGKTREDLEDKLGVSLWLLWV